MAGCSLPGNCRAQGVVPGHFPIENYANPFAPCFSFHRDARGALKKCSSLEDESASPRIKKARLVAVAVAIIEGLKSGKIGYLGLDVYDEEEEIFFEDRSGLILGDDVFARLLTFPNVIITGHQAFFTREALLNIAVTTIENITKFENDQPLEKLAG